MSRVLVVLCALALGGVAPALAQEAARVHEVKSGETLWVIARATMGDGQLWPALYRANRDQIKDPSRVYTGQRLRIPQIDAVEREAVKREAERRAAPPAIPGPASPPLPIRMEPRTHEQR